MSNVRGPAMPAPRTTQRADAPVSAERTTPTLVPATAPAARFDNGAAPPGPRPTAPAQPKPGMSVRNLPGYRPLPEGGGGRRASGSLATMGTGAAASGDVTLQAPLAIHPSVPNGPNDIMVATYNVENLFDTRDNPATADEDFTPAGREAWTEEKLDQKAKNLGRVIRSVNGNRGPDILGLVEVENRGVVERLRDKGLQGLGYEEIAIQDGPDFRGINTAILSRYPMVGQPVLHRVDKPGDPTWGHKTTRGILEATFNVKGSPLTVYMNHWPSKAGGAAAEPQRMDAARTLRTLVDQKLAEDPAREIVMLGDFNADIGETPFGVAGLDVKADATQARAAGRGVMDTVAQHSAVPRGDLMETGPLAPAPDGQPQMGTHYFHPKKEWSTLDHIVVSSTLLDNHGLTWVPGSTQVVREGFMVDNAGAPKRFYQPRIDPRAQQLAATGFADHLPVVARLRRAD